MDYMEQALSLAKLALGQASPNPAVGAVVVKGGEVVGQGYTQPPGSHHAEVIALKQAGKAAAGGTMYVTLEPCAHQGRTPPCTEAIIAAGVSEVHMAMLDPNPIVLGRGQKELKKAGIKTALGEHEAEAREVNEAYIKYITTGLPFVTAKFAISLDGKIATREGDSRWISGPESRKYVHCLRYTSDAIMAGVNTLLADNPQLTTRCSGGKGGVARKQPLRVIVDGQGRTPLDSRVFDEPGKTLLVVGHRLGPKQRAAFTEAGAEVMEPPEDAKKVDLELLLRDLAKRDITSVIVEGGGILLGSLFDQGLVDKVIAFVATIIIGGVGAKTAVAGEGVSSVAESLRLEKVQVVRLGDDIMVSGYVAK
jgi:diaminohydroxyphosphoribosylaminopyrimidine deaminase/5-amino-6-(5-phosphoribosylamino)uracil reductase